MSNFFQRQTTTIARDEEAELEYRKERRELDTQAGIRRARLEHSRRALAATKQSTEILERSRAEAAPEMNRARDLLKRISRQRKIDSGLFDQAEKVLTTIEGNLERARDRVAAAESGAAQCKAEREKKQKEVAKVEEALRQSERKLSDAPRSAQELRKHLRQITVDLEAALKTKNTAQGLVLETKLKGLVEDVQNALAQDGIEKLFLDATKLLDQADTLKVELCRLQERERRANETLGEVRSALRTAEAKRDLELRLKGAPGKSPELARGLEIERTEK